MNQTEQRKKTKPELWKTIDELELQLQLLERYLEEKGLLAESRKYVRDSIEDQEDLPFE
ncbi:MAG: hypothetical protein LKG48_10300 [Lachnospiraceae bacterium]|nr:hypothetical protein [Lachnospiraceae bacterium]MCH4063799.1 hypothetical protein [Lachnospiraceae bacterium]MCH4103478.1 hypothetical protein [Lachnospiraceae bacterium]MCI1310134.1 hypothetical protein [Lachnospiraceae bacterium]MCI1334588.1 hypothetical protein [Lachnospiraceae bacterium]